MPATERNPLPGVLVVCALSWIWSGYAWLSGSTHPDGAGFPGPLRSLVLLTVAFAVTEIVVLHVQIRHEAQTISLSEIPLVVGLVLVAPGPLLVARLLGSALVLVLRRRQPLLKLTFNLSSQLAEVTTALVVVHALSDGPPGLDGRGTTALYLAALAAALVSALNSRTVIDLVADNLSVRGYLHEVVEYPLMALAVATVGIVAATMIRAGSATTLVLVPALGAGLGAYALHANLAQRHAALGQLYRFTRTLDGAVTTGSVLNLVLAEVRELLVARTVVLAVPSADGSRWEVATLDDSGRVEEHTCPRGQLPALSGLTRTLPPQGAVLLATAPVLGELRLREAVAAPYAGTGLLLVGDRLGDLRRFNSDDRDLLASMAAQAAKTLDNGRLVAQLRHDATHDTLTGLLNRRGWEAEVDHALRTAQGSVTALLLLDIDGLKDVNDTLGRRQGDLLLQEVAARLQRLLPEGGSLGRFGGDEFAVMLPRSSAAGSVATARTLTLAMTLPVSLGDVRLEVRASVGVALAPAHGSGVVELLKRADLAMYAAKDTSQAVTVFHDALDDHGPNRLAMLADLREALAHGEITIAVQPKVLLADGSLSGVEVLARWAPASGPPVPPEVFIALAERGGLIREVTLAVLDQGVAAAAGWLAEGQPIPVAVNLSPRSLLDPDLIENVRQTLSRHALPAELLSLEITESSIIADPEHSLEVLLALRGLGVSLSLDDFGTGYSSLAYLKRLPVSEVKIDRSFITDLAHDPDDVVIVRSIAALGRSLGLQIVAEGVEDLTTWQLLGPLGCHAAQGYFLSRPMPSGRLLPWLRQQRVDPTHVAISAPRPGVVVLPYPRSERPRANG